MYLVMTYFQFLYIFTITVGFKTSFHAKTVVEQETAHFSEETAANLRNLYSDMKSDV